MIITFPNGVKKEFVNSIFARELIPYFEDEEYPIVGVRLNNEIVPLNRTVDVDSSVYPVCLGSPDGSAIYRRTLCLLLAAAAKKLYPELRLLVGHSLNYGYYYTFEGMSSQSVDLKKIESEMRSMVQADMPIETKWISYEQAIEHFSDLNQPATLKLLDYLSKPKILINRLGEYEDVYFQAVMDRIGHLKVFELLKYDDGFLLRFPSSASPDRLNQFKDIPQLFQIYKEYKKWGKLVGVSSAGDVNDLIEQGRVSDYIEISEILQHNKLAEVAKAIHAKKTTKVILIAGPSSSGKTTSAKKLSLHLKVLGYNPKVISLDDFYLGADKTPKGPNGRPDFECLEALDIELLNELLLQLFDGKTVELPQYDFKTSSRREEGKPFSIDDDTILILEGIHGINDKLTNRIPSELKFKIYLSALTQLNLDDHNRIPTSDNRLLRRIVRDANFRGSTATKTIRMWSEVRSGESKYIFPFQNHADIFFNTALDYELPVLKVYAEPLLRAVKPTEKEYSEACRLLSFLQNFSPLPSNHVPVRSVLREFIGGSQFSY